MRARPPFSRSLKSLSAPSSRALSRALRYARTHAGVVLTNDMYRDWIAKAPGGRERDARHAWCGACLLSFTFVGDELVPNPDFDFAAAAYAAKRASALPATAGAPPRGGGGGSARRKGR